MGEPTTIKIKPLTIERIIIQIEGTAPLITDRFSTQSVETLAATQVGAGERNTRSKKPPRDPEAEFLDRLYTISEGVYGFPAGGVKKAMVSAGMRVTEAQGTWLRAVLQIEGELLPIIGSEPRMRADHVVQMGRGNIRYRPQFDPWAMTVPIVYNAAEIGPTEVVSLLSQAGFCIGIGNWRPEKGGSFGTFKVTG